MLTRRILFGGAIAGSFFSQRSVAQHCHARINLACPTVIRKVSPPLPVVMLDPGHGGKDPGAIGISGIYEKYIAQATVWELRRLLLASRRYRVVLTRSDDRFIPLGGRVDLAHQHRADLFMSVHADALHDTQVRGASVYIHSQGASDHQTALLAQKENDADRFVRPRFRGVSADVAQILGSLVNEETRHHSARMAASVVTSFQNRIRLLHHPSRHAAFLVLKSTDIPSVLVEMGFMSNHLDEAFLRRAVYRQRVAQALKQAVDHYFVTRSLHVG